MKSPSRSYQTIATILIRVLIDIVHFLVNAPPATIIHLLDKTSHRITHLQNHALITIELDPTQVQIQTQITINVTTNSQFNSTDTFTLRIYCLLKLNLKCICITHLFFRSPCLLIHQLELQGILKLRLLLPPYGLLTFTFLNLPKRPFYLLKRKLLFLLDSGANGCVVNLH